MANRSPDVDWANVENLIGLLSTVTADTFILISSLAVFADPAGQDDENSSNFQKELAYGRHRRELEIRCEKFFKNCLIARLPALFGAGLKKNFLFDILNPAPTMLTDEWYQRLIEILPKAALDVMHDVYLYDAQSELHEINRTSLALHPGKYGFEKSLNEVGATAIAFHNKLSTFQYYNLDRLWADITRAKSAGLTCINLATEPLHATRIHETLLGDPMTDSDANLHHEDMHTRHADIWGLRGPYIESANHVLDELKQFYNLSKIKS
ncbi:MAG: hypothetical protein HKO02_04510 [Hyphomonadaceae bacterium]|nr:hypothetical protein [Hyphomonadaceae bacterium]